MKVKIGPYKNWVGPYQIAEKLLFWMDKEDDRVHAFGKFLAGGENEDSLLLKICNWIESKKKRKVYVRIDKYDTWNMDNTLAHIALPMLKQLKEAKHGAPNVDDADVPEELRSTVAEPKENEWDTDSNWFKRWDWVMDEMIFAFECELDESWQEKYWKVHPQLDLADYPEDEGQTSVPVRWKVKGECDWDGMKVEQDRISNGFRLFGKYYQNLWD